MYFDIFFLLFPKHFSKQNPSLKISSFFLQKKTDESSSEDDKKARDKEELKQIKPTVFYKGSKLTSRTGDRLAKLAVTGSKMVNVSMAEKEKDKHGPSTLKWCCKGGKQD